MEPRQLSYAIGVAKPLSLFVGDLVTLVTVGDLWTAETDIH